MRYDLPAVLAVALALLAAGCADESDSKEKPRSADPDATLTTGSYSVSHADVYEDGCELGFTAGSLNGSLVPVTVSGASLDINGVAATLSAGNISGGTTRAGEDVEFDCVADITISEDGTAPGDNQMDLVETIYIDNPVGAGCSSIPVALPCTTRYFARLAL